MMRDKADNNLFNLVKGINKRGKIDAIKNRCNVNY